MTVSIRSASLEDLDELVALEEHAFDSDRLSRRQLRHLLRRGRAETFVAALDGRLVGYVLLLFRRGTSVARLYSIAVAPETRGRGVGRALVEAAEDASKARDRAFVRLEIRTDNDASLALFRGLGYVQFGRYGHYYEDHADALRFQKPLVVQPPARLVAVPYYEQTLDFTCGAAALIMAMKALAPELDIDRKLELRVWREATTVFMTSGHGGCGPYGLAAAAARRGFGVEVYVSDGGLFLGDSVRRDDKREVMRIVQEDMADELRALGVPVVHESATLAFLEERFGAGAIPIVLVSTHKMYGDRQPHWLVVTGFDPHFVHVHDPFVDRETGAVRFDSLDVPVSRAAFERMARYGRARRRAAILLTAPPNDTPNDTER